MVRQHTCQVEGCETVSQRNVCSMHYERYRRNGHYGLQSSEERAAKVLQGKNIPVPYEWPAAKKCTKCGVTKTIDNFHTRKTNKGELRPYPHCKDCHREQTMANYIRVRDEKRAKRAAEKAARIVNNGICIVDGCEKKQKAMTLCAMHYQRTINGVPLDRPARPKGQSAIEGTDEFRVCTNCEEVKPVAGFYARPNGKKQSQCKVCMTDSNRFNKLMREGRPEEALEKALETAGRAGKKNVGLAQQAIKSRGLERSNEVH